MATYIPTLDQLKRALHLHEGIEKLKAELASLFGYEGELKVPAKRRGRGPGKKSAGQGSSLTAGVAPKKRGRKPGTKAAARGTAQTAGAAAKKGGRKAKRIMSPEARAKIAEAQKKRWAKQKKAGE